MPAMIRPKNKGTSIAYAILGVPENLVNDENYKGYKNLRSKREKKSTNATDVDMSYNSKNMYYDDSDGQRY